MRTPCPGSGVPVRDPRSERGAVLVHVAVAFAGLVAFSALTIDLGVLWAARTEAQNAADSAAMAGAVSLAYVDASNTDYAREAALAVAGAHQIWGETPVPNTTVGPCPAGAPSGGDCVQVEVGRGGAFGSPLPTYISRMFGFSTAVVRASGAAQVLRGNASTCLKPWAIPDRWVDNLDVTDPIDTMTLTDEDLFERYVDMGGTAGPLLPEPRDAYEAPGPSGAGTSYSLSNIGRHIQFDRENLPAGPLVSATYHAVDLARTSPGATPDDNFLLNITSCSGVSIAIGDTIMTDANIHPHNTQTGIETLIAADPEAHWDGSRVVGSAFATSPRIVAVPVYDPDDFMQRDRNAERIPLVIRNIIGLFIEEVAGRSVSATIVLLPGRFDPGVQQLTAEASFLRTVVLVR